MSRIWLVILLLLMGSCFGVAEAGSAPRYTSEEKGTFFREWLLCGPFSLGETGDRYAFEHGANCLGFYRDLLENSGGEAAASPNQGEGAVDPENGRILRWERHKSETDLISLEKRFEDNEFVVAYAFCVLDWPDQEKVILSVGSNDGVRVFLNGDLVHDHHANRWLLKDDDYVPVDLVPGENRLLVKIDEGSGDWGFCLRILDFEETIRSLHDQVQDRKKMTVVTFDDRLVAQFGTPYEIGALNPGAKVKIEARDGEGKLKALLWGRPGFQIGFPITTLDEGPVRFRAEFPLPSGETVISERGHWVGRLPRHQPAEMIRSDLAFQRDDGPFFPIGIYSAEPKDYSLLKEAGFNFVVAPEQDLDRVHEAGLLAAVPFHGDDEAYLQRLRETIGRHRDHPAVLCWMMADEPGYNRMDLLNMHRAYNLIHELDPVHPSYLVITEPRVYATFGRCCDVLAVDTYPISRKFPLLDVGDNIAKAYRTSQGDQPIWHCGQLFNWPADRMPTPEEHRFMTYHAAFEGVRGMLWYGFRWQGASLPESDPALWESHVRLLGELKTIEPFLLAEGFGERLEVAGSAGKVRALVKRDGRGGTMVLAMDTDRDEAREAAIALPEDIEGEARVLGEDRRISIEGGTVRDRYSPLGTHVYLFSKSD